jgi:trehalose 6-phosphate phosphatase
MLDSRIQGVLARHPLGLIFDIDGTLSPIVSRPEEARVVPEARALLEQARTKAHVAIVTGRTVESGAAMVNIEGLTYVGTHGMQWSDDLPAHSPPQVVPEILPYVEPVGRLLDLAEQRLASTPGIIIERKPAVGAIHYRLTSDPEQERARILALLEGPAGRSGLLLSEGKMVIEIRPPVAVNKGTALRRLVERFGLQGVVFAGDDWTDLDAMRELPPLARRGIATVSIGVQHADTPPAVLEQADVVVQGVSGMVDLLRQIVAAL